MCRKNDPHFIIPVNTKKKGYDTACPGDSINLAFPESKTRRGRVGKGIANTLDTSCNQGVMIDMNNTDVKNAYLRDFGSRGKIQDTDETCCTLLYSMGSGGGNVPLIMAMRNRPAVLRKTRTEYGKAIRKEYEAGNISEKRKNMTCLEQRTDGVTNTLTTVQKDNLVLVQAGHLYGTETNPNPQAGRVYDPEGISPTVDTCQGGNRMPKLTTERLRKEGLRIRRLTPKECWRLMGFDDSDFKKAESVCSNTQLYKQAGNSIVVNVLEGILGNLLSKERSEWLDELLEV